VKTYEGLFIFDETVQEDRLKDLSAYVTGEIEKAGGKILDKLEMGRRSFARVMQKKESGFYMSVSFKLAPAQVSVLTTRLHLNDDLFRFQITTLEPKPVAAAQTAPAPAKA